MNDYIQVIIVLAAVVVYLAAMIVVSVMKIRRKNKIIERMARGMYIDLIKPEDEK